MLNFYLELFTVPHVLTCQPCTFKTLHILINSWTNRRHMSIIYFVWSPKLAFMIYQLHNMGTVCPSWTFDIVIRMNVLSYSVWTFDLGLKQGPDQISPVRQSDVIISLLIIVVIFKPGSNVYTLHVWIWTNSIFMQHQHECRLSSFQHQISNLIFKFVNQLIIR